MVSHGYRSDFLKTKMIKKNKGYHILFLAVYFGANGKLCKTSSGAEYICQKDCHLQMDYCVLCIFIHFYSCPPHICKSCLGHPKIFPLPTVNKGQTLNESVHCTVGLGILWSWMSFVGSWDSFQILHLYFGWVWSRWKRRILNFRIVKMSPMWNVPMKV